MGQTCGECTHARHLNDINFTDGQPRVNCRHLHRDLITQPLTEPLNPNFRPTRRVDSVCPYDPSRFEPRSSEDTQLEADGSFRSTSLAFVRGIRALFNYFGLRRITR